MVMSKYPSVKPITIVQQDLAMRGYCTFSCQSMKKNKVIWVGTIQPTPASIVYTVKIEYSLEDKPRVWVLSPKLQKRNGDPIPHTFPRQRLCLFLPNNNEWSKSKIIAKTIVPWISLWLYHYEVWHATGEWLGEGIHPDHED
jgi:hypothetical protein